MTDITLPAAAGAGLLSFLSPCVLPLAPPYLCYLAGTTIEELADETTRARRDIFVASLLFVAGFATVFVALGATASVFGALLRQWSHVLSIVAGLGIVVMGAHRARSRPRQIGRDDHDRAVRAIVRDWRGHSRRQGARPRRDRDRMKRMRASKRRRRTDKRHA